MVQIVGEPAELEVVLKPSLRIPGGNRTDRSHFRQRVEAAAHGGLPEEELPELQDVASGCIVLRSRWRWRNLQWNAAPVGGSMIDHEA